jgi:hypothetical protein
VKSTVMSVRDKIYEYSIRNVLIEGKEDLGCGCGSGYSCGGGTMEVKLVSKWKTGVHKSREPGRLGD